MKVTGVLSRLEKMEARVSPTPLIETFIFIYDQKMARAKGKKAKEKLEREKQEILSQCGSLTFTDICVMAYEKRKAEGRLRPRQERKKAKPLKAPNVHVGEEELPAEPLAPPPPSTTVYVHYRPTSQESMDNLLWDPFYRMIHQIEQFNHIFYRTYTRKTAEGLRLTYYDSPKQLYTAVWAAKKHRTAVV